MTVEWLTLSSLVISHAIVNSISFSRFSSVTQSCLTLCDHGLQHARLPCPSPVPGACSNSCPSSQWCHPTISSSVVPFSSASVMALNWSLSPSDGWTVHASSSRLSSPLKTSWTTTALYFSSSWANAFLMLWVVSPKPQLLLHQYNNNKIVTKVSYDICHHL